MSCSDYHGKLNLMKAGVCCADRVTTVSPRYAEEIRTPEFGRGLEYILNENPGKLCGILNGIDYDYYNPETDPALPVNYSWKKIDGKYKNKSALQKELGLPVREVPLLAIISRLASHKGLDLVCEIACRLVSENDLQLVVLGRARRALRSFSQALSSAILLRQTIIDYNRGSPNLRRRHISCPQKRALRTVPDDSLAPRCDTGRARDRGLAESIKGFGRLTASCRATDFLC